MIWLLFAVTAAILIWYQFLRPLNYFTRMGIKQSKPWPIFGDEWKTVFRQTGFAEFVEWSYNMFPNARYSGVFQFGKPTLVIRDPNLIKQVAVRDFENFVDHKPIIVPEADPLWGGTLFALRGQRWKEMRATLSGTFTSSKMKNMFSLMNEAAEIFTQYFLDKKMKLQEVELKDTFTRFSNDVIATTAFGIKTDSLNEPDNSFYRMGKKATTFFVYILKMQFCGYLIVPKICRFFNISFLAKDVSNFFKNIINETIAARENQGIVRQDMIHILLEAKNGTQKSDKETEVTETDFATLKESADITKLRKIKKITNMDITSQAFLFFFAGVDTTSTALCFGTYELVANKEVQDKLREEIKETHAQNNGKLTYEVLLKMKYLDMVVSEILRKWSPCIVADRVCTKPCTFEPVTPEEQPVHIKVGDVIWLPIYGIHRDPKYYPEPEIFNPERFSEENKNTIQPYTYLPFSVGPRACIGQKLALLECKILFYYLLLHFEIVPSAKTVIPLRLNRSSLAHTAADGFWFAFKKIT